MFSFIRNISFLRCKELLGVYLDINTEGSFTISCAHVNEKKGSLSLVHFSENLSSVEEIAGRYPGITVASVTADGKGVMHKKVKMHSDDKVLLNQVLPNASIKEFWIQKYYIDTEWVYVSIIRKEVLDKIITAFKQKGIYLSLLYLGPFSATFLYDSLESPIQQMQAGSYLLEFENNRIFQFSRTTTPVSGTTTPLRSSDIVLSSGQIICFSSALVHFISPPDDIIKFDFEYAERDEYFYKKAFTVLGGIVLIFFFVILLGNYFLFDHFNKKSSRLSAELIQNKSSMARLKILQEELKKKEEFIQSQGLLASSRSSYYFDRMVACMPEKIMLTSMQYQPLIKKLKEGSRPEINFFLIKISGKASNSAYLNDWMKKIKREDWVSNVQTLRFSQESLRVSGEFDISVEIKKQ